MSILVICKIENNQIAKNDLKAITAAQTFQQPIICLAYHTDDSSNTTLPAYDYLQTSYIIKSNNSPETIIQTILQLHHTHHLHNIIATNNTLIKQVLPQVAALIDIDMFTDVVEIINANTLKRPMYAGDFIATIQTGATHFVASIRASAFADPILTHSSKQSIPEKINITTSHQVTFESTQLSQPKLDLTTADIVITGGRGLGEAKHFELIQQLAEKLGAAVGATRAAVDAGWVDNALQVGQTGKVIAPKLYIAIGVSGAIQHLAGIKDSNNIIAINVDVNAPMMQFADYAYEGDLFEVIPSLINLL